MNVEDEALTDREVLQHREGLVGFAEVTSDFEHVLGLRRNVESGLGLHDVGE